MVAVSAAAGVRRTSRVGHVFAPGKIFVFRDNRRSLAQRVLPDRGVRRRLHPIVTNMLSCMSLVGQPSCKGGRQLRLNEKLHQATRNTG